MSDQFSISLDPFPFDSPYLEPWYLEPFTLSKLFATACAASIIFTSLSVPDLD